MENIFGYMSAGAFGINNEKLIFKMDTGQRLTNISCNFNYLCYGGVFDLENVQEITLSNLIVDTFSA